MNNIIDYYTKQKLYRLICIIYIFIKYPVLFLYTLCKYIRILELPLKS